MKVVKGNIFDLAEQGEFDVVVHGCNCFCTMGKGIAKEVKTRYPWVYGADLKTHRGRETFLLKGDTEEDVKEQYFLVKDLHIEKHLFRLRQEWKKIKCQNSNTPEINPVLISVLDNFSTEEYLAKKMS